MENKPITQKSIETFNFLIDMACQIQYFKSLYNKYPDTIKIDTEHFRAIQELRNFTKRNDNNELIFENVVIIEDTENKGNFMKMK